MHSEDSNTVCSGNATLDQQHQWTETIYSQLLYYLSGQTAVSLLLVILSLVGKAAFSVNHSSIQVVFLKPPLHQCYNYNSDV